MPALQSVRATHSLLISDLNVDVVRHHPVVANSAQAAPELSDTIFLGVELVAVNAYRIARLSHFDRRVRCVTIAVEDQSVSAVIKRQRPATAANWINVDERLAKARIAPIQPPAKQHILSRRAAIWHSIR